VVVDEHEYDNNYLDFLLNYDILIWFYVVIVHIHELYHVEVLIFQLKFEFVNLMNYVHFLIDVIFLLNDQNSK
jgi:hypothetical protein